MSYKTNITNARKDLYKIAENAVEYGQVTKVHTKKGNIVILSEEDYNGLTETIYLTSNKELRDSLVEGKNIKLEDTIPAEEVDWDNV